MDLGIRAWAHGLKDSHLRGFGFRVWGLNGGVLGVSLAF